MTLPRSPVALGLAISTALTALSGCASTATKRVDLDPQVVEQEQQRQRELRLEHVLEQQERLNGVAFPILKAAVPLCDEDVAPAAGFRFANRQAFSDEYRSAAEKALGIGDTLQITAITPGSPADRAGLQFGDRIVGLNGEPAPVGEDATDNLGERFRDLQESGATSLSLSISRDSLRRDVRVETVEICDYPPQVIRDSRLNAFANGDQIFITTSMMRFVSDYELATIVGHELAHNAMGHIEKKQKNTIFGAILGAVADIAIAATGYNTGGAFTVEGAKLGQITHSQDFEREADYVGLYALALAGLPLDSAPRFWRHMAQENPEQIGFAHTHPTSAERFVRMQNVIEEIRYKQENDLALRPEMKDPEENRALERALASEDTPPGPVSERDAKGVQDEMPEQVAGAARDSQQVVADTLGIPTRAADAGDTAVDTAHGVEIVRGTPDEAEAKSDTLAIHYNEYRNPWLGRRHFRRDREKCKRIVREDIRNQPGVTARRFEELVRRCLRIEDWEPTGK